MISKLKSVDHMIRTIPESRCAGGSSTHCITLTFTCKFAANICTTCNYHQWSFSKRIYIIDRCCALVLLKLRRGKLVSYCKHLQMHNPRGNSFQLLVNTNSQVVCRNMTATCKEEELSCRPCTSCLEH